MSARNVLAFPLLLFITPSCTHTHRKSTAHLGIYTLMFQNVKKNIARLPKKIFTYTHFKNAQLL